MLGCLFAILGVEAFGWGIQTMISWASWFLNANSTVLAASSSNAGSAIPISSELSTSGSRSTSRLRAFQRVAVAGLKMYTSKG